MWSLACVEYASSGNGRMNLQDVSVYLSTRAGRGRGVLSWTTGLLDSVWLTCSSLSVISPGHDHQQDKYVRAAECLGWSVLYPRSWAGAGFRWKRSLKRVRLSVQPPGLVTEIPKHCLCQMKRRPARSPPRCVSTQRRWGREKLKMFHQGGRILGGENEERSKRRLWISNNVLLGGVSQRGYSSTAQVGLHK